MGCGLAIWYTSFLVLLIIALSSTDFPWKFQGLQQQFLGRETWGWKWRWRWVLSTCRWIHWKPNIVIEVSVHQRYAYLEYISRWCERLAFRQATCGCRTNISMITAARIFVQTSVYSQRLNQPTSRVWFGKRRRNDSCSRGLFQKIWWGQKGRWG